MTKSKTRIVFRADGSSAIGLGHVVRSLALAGMLKEEFECFFAIQAPTEALLRQLEEVCEEVYPLTECGDDNEDFVHELDPFLTGGEIVVLDGYRFTTPYQQHLKDKGCTVVCIDDIHAYHFVADVVINHGLLDESIYSIEPYTKLLLGPEYSLLREAFLQDPLHKKADNADNHVFICFGGADAQNLTATYLQKLLEFEGLTSVHMVVGSAFKGQKELKELAASNKAFPIYLHQNVAAQKLVDLIRLCKVAIVPGSTIAIECASVGVGIVTGYYVDNQRDIAAMLAETGMAISIGDMTKVQVEEFFAALRQALLPEGHQKLQKIQRVYFDGQSKERFQKEFQILEKKKHEDLFSGFRQPGL